MADVVVAGAALLLLGFLFWKFRMFDSRANPTIELAPVYLYVKVTPMNTCGFGALAHGPLPLCNPYQYRGEPFLAMAYVGLLYSFRLMNLWFDALSRAVRVPPGHFVVRFEYWPRSFRVGIVLSAATAALIVAGAAWNARRT